MAFSLPAEERGHTTKGPAYLAMMQARTSEAKRPHHPRHHGVAMQAHHLISQKAIFDAKLDERLEDFGYEIDEPNNLVFIPSTLQGACLLQVQPHRGNHTAERIDGSEDDRGHDPKYHAMVANRLKAVFPRLEEECGNTGLNIAALTQQTLNKISADIARKIQLKPEEARLTKVYAYFTPGNSRGCGGVDSVNKVALHACPVHRNHTNKHGPGQAFENIEYVCKEPYKLEVGN